MYSHRKKYWPSYTWNVQTSYSTDIKGKILKEFKITENDFGKMCFNIFHKINASFYHLERLKENEAIAVQVGVEMSKIVFPGMEGKVGIAGSPYEPIGYEYESFLVTVKSTLDFIGTMLASVLGIKVDNILSLVDTMQSKRVNANTLEEKVCLLLNTQQFKNLIDEYRGNKPGFKSKRNFATHDGSLPVGTINIPINNPLSKPLLSKALNPNKLDPYTDLPESQNLTDFCEDQFYKTCDLFIEVLNLLTNSKLKHGPKGSVYEQCQGS